MAQPFPDDLTCHFDCDLAGYTQDQHPSTPINTSGGLISTHRTTSYLRQSRWLTKGNQNKKEEGLNGNVSNVTADAWRLCPEFIYLLLCCCSRTSRLLLSPTSSRLSNPLWQDSWPHSWGESWFRHRPNSWQSNKDFNSSVDRIIFLISLFHLHDVLVT